MTRRHLILILVAGILVGAIAGWFRPVPPASTAAAGGSDQWGLPGVASLERATAVQVSQARTVPWLGGNGASDAATGAATSWVLHGVLQARGMALVQAGDAPAVLVRTGDTLPDGSRLAAVEEDSIVIERDGCLVRRPLYERPAEQEQPPVCPGAGAPEEAPST